MESLCITGPVWFCISKISTMTTIVNTLLVLGEVTRTKDGHSKNLTRTRNVPPKCNKQVTTKQQTRFSLTSIN
jgi:hypothetical protein